MRKIICFVTTFLLCLTAMSQTPDQYIYFDLAAGPVDFYPGADYYVGYVGYVYVNGVATQISGRHLNENRYYIYQSSTITDSPGYLLNTGYSSVSDFNAKQNIRIPVYNPISGPGGQEWSAYSTNNTDVLAVQRQWVNSAIDAKRTSTQNHIWFNNAYLSYDLIKYNIILDNVWSEYYDHDTGLVGSISTDANSRGEMNFSLKNYSKFNHIKYDRTVSMSGGMHFTSIDGAGATSGSLVVTYTEDNGLNPTSTSLNASALIGGRYYNAGGNTTPCYNLFFDGGTIYVGLQNYVSHSLHMCPTTIGGGANAFGDVTINGGKLTAVTSSTGAAIGGGGGSTGCGAGGQVTISGGEIYVYNFGLYNSALDIYNSSSIAGTAIGGGSTQGIAPSGVGEAAVVTINGGYVYAQSVGGNAIGGGSSSTRQGGSGTVTINSATVCAKSVSGNIGSTHWDASTAIGGGTGGSMEGVSGGDAIINISGSTYVTAGSIGGGNTNNSTGKIGAATVVISGNPDIRAQFIMNAGSSSHCSFNMTGGTIHDSDSESQDFILIKKDGAALWMDDPNGVVKIADGIIKKCKANCGGAIYQSGGTLTLSGVSVLESNNSLQNGGAVYLSGGSLIMKDAVSVKKNEATTMGGGLFIIGGNLSISGGEMVDNTANTGNGGGVYVDVGSSTTPISIVDCDISGNTAHVSGGGLFAAKGDITLNNVSLGGNGANKALTGSGGAMYAAAGNLNITNAQISNNTATALDGGAFYVGNGTVTLNGEIGFSSNSAGRNGGAICVSGGSISLSQNSSFRQNSAQNGAGVYVGGGDLTMLGGTIENNTATGNGGGAYVAVGTVTFNSNVQNNTASNGGGLYLASGAIMTYKGGIISGNKAQALESSTATTAYHGGAGIEGCGGGIYLQSGTDAVTTLSFDFGGAKTFGLYSNEADMAGAEIVSEGGNTLVQLPPISDMQLVGFEGNDASPYWYQDYFAGDTGYKNNPTDGRAVEWEVTTIGRFKDIMSLKGTQYLEHRIPEGRLGYIVNNYLCVTMSFSMLDITLKATNLLGHETAMFKLIRHGANKNTRYDILLRADDGATKTLKNMPWGTYSVIPNNSWNYAYDPLESKENIRIGETNQYLIEYKMHHKNAASLPQHDEEQAEEKEQ